MLVWFHLCFENAHLRYGVQAYGSHLLVKVFCYHFSFLYYEEDSFNRDH